MSSMASCEADPRSGSLSMISLIAGISILLQVRAFVHVRMDSKIAIDRWMGVEHFMSTYLCRDNAKIWTVSLLSWDMRSIADKELPEWRSLSRPSSRRIQTADHILGVQLKSSLAILAFLVSNAWVGCGGRRWGAWASLKVPTQNENNFCILDTK